MSSIVAIDPRMAARRIEVARAAGRQRLRWVLVLVAMLALAGVGAGLTRTALLDVDEISVSGAIQTRADDVIDAAAITPGDALTDLDLAAARERIAALPRVLEVRSTRSWSGTVEFEITERVPAAQVASESGWLVVDLDGRILEVRPDRRPDLPATASLEGSQLAGGWIASGGLDTIAVAAAVHPTLAGVVDSVRRTDDAMFELMLHNDGVVRLGSAEELELKLRSVEMMVAQVNLSCLAVLDVRVPEVPVLTRGGGCP